MLTLSGKTKTPEEGYQQLATLIKNKQALPKFAEFITVQGGDPSILRDDSKLPQAKYIQEVNSLKQGYVTAISAAQIGYAAMRLGAGREYKGQTIDLAAGVEMQCRIGQAIQPDQPLATIYTNDEDRLTEATLTIQQAIQIENQPPGSLPLLLGLVDKNGYHH
jgi:thymidine phosphorylase